MSVTPGGGRAFILATDSKAVYILGLSPIVLWLQGFIGEASL
jgi:hypothetical protein